MRFRMILAGCALLFALSSAQDDATKRGLITFVEGTAKKQKVQETDWNSVQLHSEVSTGERIRTFSDSRAELDLAKLDRIRLAPKTTIEILKLYEETKDKVLESQIALQSGDLWAHVAKKPGGLKFSISTPVAAAAITGTSLRLHVEADSSSELKVYSGEVVLRRNAAPSQGAVKTLAPYQINGPQQISGPQQVSVDQWTLIVRSMQKARIDKKGQVTQSGSFSDNDPDENQDWVKWNKQRDQEQQQ
jgi:hypothetical protein